MKFNEKKYVPMVDFLSVLVTGDAGMIMLHEA